VWKHFPDVAGSDSNSDAVTNSDTNANADANPDADAHANTNADTHSDAGSWRVQCHHHDHTESGAMDWRRRRGM
jgi:hypothetical protein